MNDTITLSLVQGDGAFEVPGSLTQSTVFYFMRAASCAQCNRHTRELDAMQSELQKHAMEAVVVIPEDITAGEKLKKRNNLTIPVMSGHGTAHALAGLDKKFLGLIQQSGTVVVDVTGKVLYKRIATNPEESFKKKEFQQYLDTL